VIPDTSGAFECLQLNRKNPAINSGRINDRRGTTELLMIRIFFDFEIVNRNEKRNATL
jgi:hypothetical protein